MSHIWQRHRLFIVGIVVVAAATATLLFFARDKRFDAGGVAINPAARVNEEKTYELVVWEEELIIPWAAKTQSEMLVDAIRQFQRLRPNAAVTYTIIAADDARDKLSQAVVAGVPPDVYGTARGVVFHPSLQVPATPYLTGNASDEPAPLLPAATQMLSLDSHMWGWPRALSWQMWLGRAADADADLPPSPDGGSSWTWEQFQRWADARTRSRAGSHARSNPVLAFNVGDVVILEQLMAGAGAPAYTDPEGNLLWSEPLLTDVASFLRTLQQENALPAKAGDGARARLAALFAGDAAVVGPVGPHLAQAVFRHSPDEYTLLPVPHRPSANSATVLDVSAYFVFRHDPYAGDDHTRLAVELAQFLAGYSGRWLVESLALLPVHADRRTMWAEAPIDSRSRSLLQAYAERSNGTYNLRNSVQVELMRQAVLPHWNAFWSESVTPEQFAGRLADSLRQTLGTNGGQN